MASIGKYLKELRQAARMTTREASIRSGVSSPYISEVEQGKKNPSPLVLRKLAKVYEVNYEELFSVAGITEEEFKPLTGESVILKMALREFEEKYVELKKVIESIIQ